MKKTFREYLRDVKYLRIFFLAVGILLACKVIFDFDSMVTWINQVMRVIGPFLEGLVIAYCLNIPCQWLERKLSNARRGWIRKIAKPASIIFIYLLIILLIILALGTLIPMIFESITQLTAHLPTYFNNALLFLQDIPSFGILEFDIWIDSLVEAKPWNSLLSQLNTSSLLNSIQYVTGFFSSVFNICLAMISSVYFLLEYNRMKVFIKRLVGLIKSENKRSAAAKYIKLVDISFRKFFTCQLLDSLIIGTVSTIEFFILKSPYALLLGLMLAVFNIIPYFGSIIATIIAVIIMGFTNGVQTALLAAVILLITQQLDGNFIQPKIMGTSFSMSPILIIIGITVGGSLGGIAGMIFAIPVVNVFKTILEEHMRKRESSVSHESINNTEEHHEKL